MMKKRMTFTLDEKLLDQLRRTSEKTLIPQARIVEVAIIEKLKSMGEYKE